MQAVSKLRSLFALKFNRPLISVVVTSYNNAKFLPKCLTALTRQTLENIEIICIDDASSDGSAAILREFAAKDKRIRAFFNRRNMGPSPSVARNRAMRKARAKLMMFCDGDDYYDETMCEKMYQAITTHQTDLVISEIAITYQAHKGMKASDDGYYGLKFQGLQNISDQIIRNIDFAPTNKIFRKSIINRYYIRFPKKLYYEDAYFSLAYLSASKTIYFLNEKLYHYIRHRNSIMSRTWSKQNQADPAIDHVYIIAKWFDFLKRHRLLGAYNQTYWQLFEAYLWLAIEHSKTPEHARLAREAANRFVEKNKTWFDFANKETRDKIYRLKDA